MVNLTQLIKELEKYYEDDFLISVYDYREDYVHDELRGESIIVDSVFSAYTAFKESFSIRIYKDRRVHIIKKETYLIDTLDDNCDPFYVDDYEAKTLYETKKNIVLEAEISDFEDYIDLVENFESKLVIELEAKKEATKLQNRYRRNRESLMAGFLVSNKEDSFVNKELVNVYFRRTIMKETKVISHKYGYNHLTEAHDFHLDSAEITETHISFKNLGRELQLPLHEPIDKFKDDKEWHDN